MFLQIQQWLFRDGDGVAVENTVKIKKRPRHAAISYRMIPPEEWASISLVYCLRADTFTLPVAIE